MKSKVVLFDWNGVIDRNIIVNDSMVEYWKTLLSVFPEELSESYIEECLIRMYKEGHVLYNMDKTVHTEVMESVKEILNEFKLDSSYDAIKALSKNLYCLSTMRPYNLDRLNLLQSYKGKCEIGLLSNCNQFDLIALDNCIDRSKLDHDFVTCLMHKRMDSEDFYFKVQERLCRPVENTMFVTMDENRANIARKLGWNVELIYRGIHVEELENSIDEFLSN